MNIYLLFSSDIVKFVLESDEGGAKGMGVLVRKVLFCYFRFLECFNCAMQWGLSKNSFLEHSEIACFCLFRDVRVSSLFPYVTAGVQKFSFD